MTFPLEIDAGFIGHLALHPFVRHPVEPAVLDEVGAGFDEAEGHVIIHALLTKRLDPCEIAGPGTVIVLPAALDPLDLPGGQPGSEAHRADEGGAHDALMLEGQLQQEGDALIRPALVLTGDIEKDVLPPISPIVRETAAHPLGPLGQQEEHYVPALADDAPGILPPLIRFL